MRPHLAVVLALAGCYHPLNLGNCDVPCGAGQVCPGGMTCSAGRCAAAGEICGPPGLDGATGSDGRSVDDGGVPCSRFLSSACVDESKATMMVGAGRIDDTACPDLIEQPDMSPVCLYSAQVVSVDDTSYFVGPYPVAIAANTITITGTLSVASRQPGPVVTEETIGAGAEHGCTAVGVGQPQSGGGAGGSFATDGGDGGRGWAGSGNGHFTHGQIQTLEGGCAGDPITAQVPGGHGGGAIWLFAASQIKVAGTIEAGGEGGAGGSTELVVNVPGTGGGGGGAGGMIGLESPAISIENTAYVVANGGGGGGGAATDGAGDAGADGGTKLASGGKGGGVSGTQVGTGGNGGAGAYGSSGSNGDGVTANAGGGGGGGDGAIYLIGAASWSGAVVVPSPSTTLP